MCSPPKVTSAPHCRAQTPERWDTRPSLRIHYPTHVQTARSPQLFVALLFFCPFGAASVHSRFDLVSLSEILVAGPRSWWPVRLGCAVRYGGLSLTVPRVQTVRLSI